jgi:glyoxylase I family protein
MSEVIGIGHVYVTVSDLGVSEAFYDRVMIEALGFRKNKFALAGDPHVQYFNRQFGFMLRPTRVPSKHEPYSPAAFRFSNAISLFTRLRLSIIDTPYSS